MFPEKGELSELEACAAIAPSLSIIFYGHQFSIWLKHVKERRASFAVMAEKMNFSLFVLLFICFMFAMNSARALDPGKHVSQYAHSTWRVQDGIFNGTPETITQTTDGYLWMGTSAGLVRFDGVRFVPWTAPDGNQLPSATIMSLLGARDGSLWIGTFAGLSHWQGQHLTNYPEGRGIISRIIEDSAGTVWISRFNLADAAGSLCRVAGTTLRCYAKADGIPFDGDRGQSLAEDTLGNLWIGSDTALVRWKAGLSTTYNLSGLKSNIGMGGVIALAATPEGSLWAGTGVPGPGLGLLQLVQGHWKPFRAPGLDGSTLEVLALLVDRENALWIGTMKQGIYRIHGGKVDHFSSADGLSGDYVTRLYEDREGNLWAVTSKGLDSFHDIPVTSFSSREGLSTDEVDSVFASRDGTVWMGNAGALDALRQGSVSSIQARKGLPGNQVTSMLEDHAGRLWMGIDNTMSIYQNGRFTRINMPDGSPTGMIIGMTEDTNNNIWAAAGLPFKELIRIQDRRVREVLAVPQIPPTRTLVADPHGGMWLGLMSGDLARYRYGKTQIFHFNRVADSRVNQVAVTSDGSVLGATAFGLVGWKGGKQQILSARNGLPCDGLNAFVSDSQGALWLYTQCGLVEIADSEMQRWWQHPDSKIQLRIFDALDGVQPGFAPFLGAARSPDGRLWFANSVVLQMIDPAHLPANPIPPPVHIEEIVADRKRYAPGDNLRLPRLTRDLEIDYTALSYVVPQRVRFRYKLEDHDVSWQEPGTRRQAFYTDLRPGEYRFHVIACNNDGVWNDAGATLYFSIAPAWYQTIELQLFCLVSGVLLVWAIYRLRVRQMAATLSARFDERSAERTRLARELHDTLIQTIQASKLVADDALDQSTDLLQARRALERLSNWLGQAMQEGRAALNSLRTSTTLGNDLAESLQRAAEECVVRGAMKVTFSVNGIAAEMHPIVRDEVYRIGYEAIRNACQHSGASTLAVKLCYTQDVALSVSDNGRGIDPEVAVNGKDGHFGLRGMRERAVRIGGKLTLVSLAISGTEVKLVVPGGIAYRSKRSSRSTLLVKVNRFLRKTDGTTRGS